MGRRNWCLASQGVRIVSVVDKRQGHCLTRSTLTPPQTPPRSWPLDELRQAPRESARRFERSRPPYKRSDRSRFRPYPHKPTDYRLDCRAKALPNAP